MGIAGKVTVLDTPLEARVAEMSLFTKKASVVVFMGGEVDFPPVQYYDLSLQFPNSELLLYLKLPRATQEMAACADGVYNSYTQGKALTIIIDTQEEHGGNRLPLPAPLKAVMNVFLALTTFYRAEYKTAWGKLKVAGGPTYDICFSYREGLQWNNEVHDLVRAN